MSPQPSAMSGAFKSPAPQATPNASKQQLKTNSLGKTLDAVRKQAASPVDATSRKPPPPKAWTQGTNPITQRSSSTTPAVNGLSNGTTKNSQPKPQQENSPSNKHASDRLLFLLANYTGMEVAVFLKNGDHFNGIFSSASTEPSDPHITLKYTKKLLHQVNGTTDQTDDYIGEGQDHVATFSLQDVVDLSVNNLYLAASEIRTQQPNAPAFRTDVEISGNLNIRERELQPWQPSADTAIDMSLEDSTRPGEWDQFAANEALYNVKSDYDENLYTTVIDRSDPDYRRKAAEAERIAREIERSAPVNSHVAEERRMNADKDGGLDEEERYSGVRRDTSLASLLKQGAPNAYVPPSRRPITSQPTVPGAPFDPAIVSVARPSPSTATNSDCQAALSKQQEQKLQADDTKTEAVSSQASATAATPIPTLPTVTAPSADASTTTAKPAHTTSIAKAIPSINAGKGATEGVERKVLDSFKQFSNNEKLRVQQHQRVVQERQRASARQEKSVKLNDLKKFAENFKLYSRVPEDLVPILAKTKEKQNLIVSKAETQAREKEQKLPSGEASPAAVLPVKPEVSSSSEVNKAQTTSQPSRRPEAVNNEPSSPLNQRQRMSHNMRQNQNMPPRGPGMSHGIPPRQQYRAPMANMHIPTPLPPPEIRSPPTGPALDITSPSLGAAARLNVKAMEFRPNPSASAFTPTSPTKASPPPAKRPSVSGASSAKFFSRKSEKPLSERTPLKDAFNPVKHMLEVTAAEGKTETFASNGGIPQAFRTPPTWEVTEANKDKTYRDVFSQSPVVAITPMHTPTNNVMAHSHQLPPHLQNGPLTNQTPRFYPPQPHHPGQHFDEHRMQYASSNPSVHPSPRLPHAMAYGPQMHQQQMQHFPAGMPPYMMSPSVVRPVAAQQFGSPQGPPMGGHMMVQQSSNGPFMNGPMSQQVPMYASPVPGHVQPHFPGHPAPQPGPGFGRGHPMSHQGSQQGHPGQIYMQMPPSGPIMMQQHPGQMQQMRNFPQGQFPGGPQGQHGYPMQHRAMSNQGYNHNQVTPRQHHAAPHQGPSPGMPPMHAAGPGDEGK